MDTGQQPSAADKDEAVLTVAPGRAMRVAAALQAKGSDEFAKPGSIVEVKFVKGQSLSHTASRLLALMILTAGGAAAQDRSPRMRQSANRRGHKGNGRYTNMLAEFNGRTDEEGGG